MKIREALRLRESGLNHTQIALSGTVGAARSTIIELFKRCDAAGLTYGNSMEMSDNELESTLYPRKHEGKRKRKEINEEAWFIRITTSGYDVQSIWEEYIHQEPDGLSYGQFSRRVKQYRELKSPELSYPKQRKPGEVLEVDWSGDTLAIVYDSESEQWLKAHFFVSSMGFSEKIFVRAYPDEKEAAWIDAHNQAFRFYQALPRIVTPDNTTTAISKSHRYEPQKNPIYSAWASHYAVAIIPARSGRPKDKDRTEGAVHRFQQKILPKLREQIFFSFESLNQFLLEQVEILNQKPFQKRPGSRSQIYIEVDLPSMRTLPAHEFEPGEYKMLTVSRKGYHVNFDGHLYSVPYHLAGQKILLKATTRVVELFFDNKRIAYHQRCRSPKQRYVTDKQHMPKSHQAQAEVDAMSRKEYLNWAQSIGPETTRLIQALLDQNEIEEQTYPACIGILRLEKQSGATLLEAACLRVRQAGLVGYHHVKKQVDQLTEQAEKKSEALRNQHANLRGGNYYGGKYNGKRADETTVG